MPSRPDELEDFKTDIDLRQVAASLGYEINLRRSSKGSAVMDHPDGDRIIVAIAPDQHWIYCSVRDPADAGSVIDFWQRRSGGNLGAVRKALRPFLRGPAPPLPSRRSGPEFLPRLVPVERDILAVRAQYESMNLVSGQHLYLTETRKIPASVLGLPPFVDRLRSDDRGNAIFPHFNRDGLCGFEIKNEGFTGFARGGVKGLWASVPAPEDDTLIIAETAIDALSYAVMNGHDRRIFVSTSGQMNNEQPALLCSAIQKLPQGGRVVLALDNDKGGDDLAQRLMDIYAEADRIDLELVEDRPESRGMDWNDALRATTPPLPDLDIG